MPRNPKPAEPRARHSRAAVRAAAERKRESRFRRLKNEPMRLYYGAVLADVREWSWIHSPEPARSELVAAVGYDAPVIHVHPEVLRRLPRWVRRDLYLASQLRLEQLADRVHYRDHQRDPWDYQVPLSVLDGHRSREKRRWLEEAWREARDPDPEGRLLGAGKVHERLVDELLKDPLSRDLYFTYLEQAKAYGRGEEEGRAWELAHGAELRELERLADEADELAEEDA